jgi:hypothetical protein
MDTMKMELAHFLNCDRSVFDGLSRREIIGWVVCLALSAGIVSADASDVLKSDSFRKGHQQNP